MAVLDFDSHYDQIKGEPTSIVVRGEEFELPPDLPMMYVVLTQDPEFRKDINNSLYVLLCLLFEQERVEKWMTGDECMSRDEYTELINMVCGHFFTENYEGVQGDGDPKALSGSSKEKSLGSGG